MKVKLLTMSAGPRGVVQPGTVIDVTDDEAKALISGHYAVAMDKPAVETATIKKQVEKRG